MIYNKQLLSVFIEQTGESLIGKKERSRERGRKRGKERNGKEERKKKRKRGKEG